MLDGHWKAESAPGFYQLADLSLGGCFLQAHKAPAAGQTGTLTIYFKHDGPMVVDGEVVPASRVGGFGVRFPNLTSSHEFQLSIQLETLKDEEYFDRFPVSAYVWKTRKPELDEPATDDTSEPKEEHSHDPRTPKTPAGEDSD
jgi:PilZ domain